MDKSFSDILSNISDYSAKPQLYEPDETYGRTYQIRSVERGIVGTG